MRQGNDGTDRHPLSRRDVLKGAAAATVVVAAASTGLPGSARAASNVVKGYGVTTSQLKDWSIMEKANGIKMEFTGTNADIGTFMRDVISNDLGETHDIFIFDGGTEDILGPQGYYAEVIEDRIRHVFIVMLAGMDEHGCCPVRRLQGMV